MSTLFLRLTNFYLIHLKHTKCCICGEPATLQLSKHKYICEDCAQIQGELSN